ncbi:MAG: hypothetical protein KDG89_00010 [Geminicoccaceae bacterium]|nr:hypothetical protein [Geminicoccaceae bacterium]
MSTLLLTRRLGELQRRREALLERQDRLRRSLPEWTFAPLRLVGMSADEIRAAVGDMHKAQDDAGLDAVEGELNRIDDQIEEMENALLTSRTGSIDGVRALLDLAIARLGRQAPSDPSDPFYDYGDARVLRLLEHAADELRGTGVEERRRVG